MKIICGMATTAAREKYAAKAKLSLMNNTIKPDVWVYNNDRNSEDFTDNAKFYALMHVHRYEEPTYFFSCDDDLIYPENYIEHTIEQIERFNSIVTYHGRKLVGEDVDYYKGHVGFRCLGEVDDNVTIDVAGTGVTAFRLDYFNPKGIHKAKDKKMSDLVFSLEAAKQKKRITILAHSEGWIKALDIPRELTIHFQESVKLFHAQRRGQPQRQVELANEIYRLNYAAGTK